MALYLMPLQIVIVSRAYLLFRSRKAGVMAVIAFSFLVQLTWLNFAQHAKLWVPYRSTLLEDPNDQRNGNAKER
jgi:hypothetical protein